MKICFFRLQYGGNIRKTMYFRGALWLKMLIELMYTFTQLLGKGICEVKIILV